MQTLGITELMAVERLFDFALSPVGDFAILSTKRIDLPANTQATKNYRLNLLNNELLPLDLGPGGGSGFYFTPDGAKVFYACDGQIYMANADASHPQKLTSGLGGASNPVPSADGKRVIFARDVYKSEHLQERCTAKGGALSLAESHDLEHPKAQARIADSLLYRHWDEWRDNRRSALFIYDLDSRELCRISPLEMDCPPLALGSERDYDFSPCGQGIVYVANPDAFLANSTNNCVYYQKLDGTHCVGQAQCISTTQACDTHPRFMDANHIVYLGMQEPGYEADYNRIKVYNLESQETRVYLEDFERSPDSFQIVAPNVVIFLAQDFAHSSFYELYLDSAKIVQLTAGRTYSKPCFKPSTREILCIHQSLTQASECVLLSALRPFEPRVQNGAPETKSQENLRTLTQFNAALEGVQMRPGQSLWFKGAGGTDLEGYVVLPPDYEEGRRYPMILLIHGGPQGAFQDSFHYRWNVQMFAAVGAVVAFCNPRGSTGYGRELTREISNDWSGKCPTDILNFVDAVLKAYPQIDPERISAAGASFGGYMINYLMGVTDRFKALVSHDGIFNTELSGFVTDELWFSEKEFGGRPQDVAKNYIKHSPHLNVKKFKTPTLVIHGERDYRCCINEGVALFCALQYQGVSSRLLTFPEEGHWVLQPANAQQWYHEVLGWLMRYGF